MPYSSAQHCLRDLHTWLLREYQDQHGLRPHFPIEIRFSAADDIWLSPSRGQETCWIGIVQFKWAIFLGCQSQPLINVTDHMASMCLTENSSEDLRISLPSTAAGPIGRNLILFDATRYVNYTLTSTTSSRCWKTLTHLASSATNISSVTSSTSQFPEEYSSYEGPNIAMMSASIIQTLALHISSYTLYNLYAFGLLRALPSHCKRSSIAMESHRHHNPSCSRIDSRTRRSYSGRLSR